MPNMVHLKQEDRKTIGQRHIYTQEIMEVLRVLKEGERISYDALSGIIGLGVTAMEPGYGYQKTARDILEKEESIVFEVIAKEGLRRMSPEEVAMSTIHKHIKEKKSMIRRNTIRINTVSDSYDGLSEGAKMKTTLVRTVLSFDSEMMKKKNVSLIEDKVVENKALIGFDDTLSLFRKEKV